uniref:EF-hand domain-containing protein n=1 Tax=Theileria annulata TaxID=5874 RepID=A0A3B0N875_THEAN
MASSEINVNELEGTHFTKEEVKNLINKFKNEQYHKNEQLSSLLKNMNDTIDRNSLYHIFKTGNRITFKEFEEFLTHLNLNQNKINTQELYHNLLQQYSLE